MLLSYEMLSWVKIVSQSQQQPIPQLHSPGFRLLLYVGSVATSSGQYIPS